MSKPAIPTYDKRTGEKIPMVVCATLDLPGVNEDGSNVIYVDRDFHKSDGTEAAIKEYLPKSRFITVDHLTDGQASSCLCAKDHINNNEELLIAGCDNGMEYDEEEFNRLRAEADVLVFTYRHNESVLKKPGTIGWMIGDKDNNVIGTSIKKPISDNPMEDHAVVATFWFKMGGYFVRSAERMIEKDDRVNGEFYVDQVIYHALQLGYRVKLFEIERYIGWGTPEEYEIYQKTYEYWRGFVKSESALLGGTHG